MSRSSSKPPGKLSASSNSGGGGGWGSLFSNAITGLESRLDNILTDDPEASAKPRGSQVQNGKQRAVSRTRSKERSAGSTAERDASRTRAAGSDRLAERLAKATAQKKIGNAATAHMSNKEFATTASGRQSEEVRRSAEVRRSGESRRSGEANRAGEDVQPTVAVAAQKVDNEAVPNGARNSQDTQYREEAAGTPPTLLNSVLPLNPARPSSHSSTRPSVEISGRDEFASSRQSTDVPNGSASSKTFTQLEEEMEQMRADHAQAEKQRQEEMHAHLERIDALQAKLRYLAKETVAAAKEANAAAPFGSAEAKLAEKDEQIGLLMEEGEDLSKKELKHLQTIKKLRAKVAEDEKAAVIAQQKVSTLEVAEAELKQKVRRAEIAQRQALEDSKEIQSLEQQLEAMKKDRDKVSESVSTLKIQLMDAEKKFEQALKVSNSKGSEADKARIAELENALEDAQIEKKLIEDRAKAESRKLKEELERQRQRSSVRELEMTGEITSLDSRLEAMRTRAEEASSENGASGESGVKLMRQIETLQSQYSNAKSNWETIEGSLNARISTLEQERDEVAKREAEVRKKARDLAAKSRKSDDEVEALKEQLASSTAELEALNVRAAALEHAAAQARSALAEAKADTDRQRRVWESELANRIEDEKSRWQRLPTPLRTASPTTLTSRKASFPNPHRPAARLTSPDLASLNLPHFSPHRHPTLQSPFPSAHSPSLSRQESCRTFSVPPTPDIEQEADFDPADPTPHSSPHNTIADLISTSTSAAGPSVQLVSRLSTAVRRLETEKSSFKDEILLLRAQRDEARGEIVGLMREAEEGKRVEILEKDLAEVNKRYEACLQIVGEKEEEVEDLKQDVNELKGLYRELVERKVGNA